MCAHREHYFPFIFQCDYGHCTSGSHGDGRQDGLELLTFAAAQCSVAQGIRLQLDAWWRDSGLQVVT